jgi:hypothetical protein
VTKIVDYSLLTVKYCMQYTRTMAVPYFERLVAGFPPWRPGFELRSRHVGFVVDKVPKYRLLHIHHLPFGVGTIGQLVADVPSELNSHLAPRK